MSRQRSASSTTDPATRLKEGWLQKKSPSMLVGFQKRWMRLDDNHLYYMKVPESSEDLGFIELNTSEGVECLDKTVTLRAFDPKRNSIRAYEFRAESEAEAKEWKEAIQGVVEKLRAEAVQGVHRESLGSQMSPSEEAELQEEQTALKGAESAEVDGEVETVETAAPEVQKEELEIPPPPPPEEEPAPAEEEGEDEAMKERREALLRKSSEVKEAVKARLVERAKALVDPKHLENKERAKAGLDKKAPSFNAAVKTVQRSAAAERFAKGIVQKEAALADVVNATTFKQADVKRSYADADKIEPLVNVLKEGIGNAKIAAAGALANLALGKEANKLYIASLDSIPGLVSLGKEGPAAQHPALVALANIAGDDDVKDLLVYEGVVEPLCAALEDQTKHAGIGAAVILSVNLASRDDGREALMTSGAYKALIRCMNAGAPEVRSNAAAAVANVAFHKNNCEPMIKVGVIPALKELLLEGSDSAKSNVCLALSIYAAASVSNAVLLKAAGVVEPLVEHLKHTQGNAQLSACQAVANMACAKEVKVALSEAGAVGPLVQILKTGTAPAKRSAAAGLANLANAGNEAAIADLGAIPLLVSLLTAQASTRVTAAKALANLASVEPIRKLIGQSNVVEPLLHVMSEGEWDGVAATALALARLSLDPDTKAAIIAKGGMTVVTKRLAGAPPECQGSLASALQNLSI